jgi:hypothetical protein
MALGFSVQRVHNKAHSWGDMLGTAAIVNVISYLVVPRFKPEVSYWPSLEAEEKSVTPKLKQQRIPSQWVPVITPSQEGRGLMVKGAVRF